LNENIFAPQRGYDAKTLGGVCRCSKRSRVFDWAMYGMVRYTLMISCLLSLSSLVPVWCWWSCICCRVSRRTAFSWSTNRSPVMLTKLWRKSSKSRLAKSCTVRQTSK